MLKRNKESVDNKFFLVCLLAFFICVVIDLVTKGLAEFFIEEHEVIKFIPWFMNLTLEYNSGMAFSWLSDNPLAMDIITWLTVPVMIALLVGAYWLPKQYNPHRFLLCVVAGGAFGNFVDRILIAEGVRDFMDISSIGFGVCNFADYFITIGGVCLLFCLLFVGEDAVLPLIGKKKNSVEEQATDKTEEDAES